MSATTTETAPAATTPAAPAKITSASAPKAGQFPGMKLLNTEPPADATPQAAAAASATAPPAAADATPPAGTPAEINEEQMMAFFKAKGIEGFSNIDELKSKLAPAAPPVELTDAQKAEAAAAKTKRLLDIHLRQPGQTIDTFAEMQRVANTDAAELGRLKVERDLAAAGFPVEQIPEMIKKMNLDVSPEELADMSDEDKAQIQKERDFATKKMEKRGMFLQQTAKNYFQSLENVIADEDAENTLKTQHADIVSAAIPKFLAEVSIEMGKVNDVDVSPIPFKAPDSVAAELQDLVGDRDKLKKLLINNDGSINLGWLMPKIAAQLTIQHVAKTAYMQGEHNAAQKLKETFGEKPMGGSSGAASVKKDGAITAASAPKKGSPFQK